MIEGQTEAFPQTPAEKRLARMSKIQVKLTEDVDKADKAIENAVEKHRVALALLEDCESVIRDLQEQMKTDGVIEVLASRGALDKTTGEVTA